MSDNQQQQRTHIDDLLHPLNGKPPPDLLVPIGVTYDSIITNPDEIISISNLIRLLRSIMPKLGYLYELVELSTHQQCQEIKEMMLLVTDHADDDRIVSAALDSEIGMVGIMLQEAYVDCKTLLSTIKGTLPSLVMASNRAVEKLENHTLNNGEIDLLKLLFVHREFTTTVFEMFRQVDEIELNTIQKFERVASSRKSFKHKFNQLIWELEKSCSPLTSDSCVSSSASTCSEQQQDYEMADTSEDEIDAVTEYVDYIKEYL